YSFNWTQDANNKTTISMFYNGQSGNPYSYVIGGSAAENLNNETGSTSANRSLIYIPDSQNDINLVDYEVDGSVISAEEQWNNLNTFIEEDAYLSANRGQYAEKNGAWGPFGHIFDLAIRQDFGLTVGGQRHRFQVSLDISNFGNLLNNEWGTVYSVPGSFNNYVLYQFEGYADDGTTPEFTFRDYETGTDAFDISGLASRWSMLFGLRYMFN
ncbi:MAG: hypothetical protein ACOCYO_07045, partial [Bacteroidota bacterium]